MVMYCRTCKKIVGAEPVTVHIKELKALCKQIGKSYDKNGCVYCNAGQIIKYLMDNQIKISKEILNKLPRKIYFEDSDLDYEEKFYRLIKEMREN